jgi:hypothetical protein
MVMMTVVARGEPHDKKNIQEPLICVKRSAGKYRFRSARPVSGRAAFFQP